MGNPLLRLVPIAQQQAAVSYAAIEMLASCAVGIKITDDGTSGDEFRAMIEDMLGDAKRLGLIGDYWRILNRFEITPPNREDE